MALILILRPTGLTRGRELLEWRGESAAARQALAEHAAQTVEASDVIKFEPHKARPQKDVSMRA